MKGIIITKTIIILLIIAVAAYLILAESGYVPIPSQLGVVKTQTTIKDTNEASSQITEIGTNVDDLNSLLEDVDNSLS